ncbi:P-loop containing nucleoside triphosphate hydrolase protein [Pyrenochaeta sp. MPI-SDFR-AT-0127]|nr:P-loop containing nucleoside triphosphate hydrolase protein [Pyrenochaeta sp. MPI-SDFR-AT-0127]
MMNFEYGNPLDRHRASPRSAYKKVGDVDLWTKCVHLTGYMEGLTPGADRLEQVDFESNDSTTDIDSSGYETEEGGDKTKKAQRVAPMHPTLSDEEVIRKAFELFSLGLQTPSHNISSPYSLKQTPPEFLEHHIEFMPHQKSEAGRLIRMVLGSHSSSDDNIVSSEDQGSVSLAANDPIDSVHGAVVDFEMGLGKTYIIIALLNAMIQAGRQEATLLLVPVQLLSMWDKELSKFLVSEHLVYRPEYPMEPDHVESFSVVLTSYDDVRREYEAYRDIALYRDEMRNRSSLGPLPRRRSYPLMVIVFGTIIADEVTKITRSSSKTSRAACTLQALNRIGLTGTPLENDYVELQTLLEFLRIKPWDDAQVFNSYFIARKKKRSKAKTLKGYRLWILAMSLRACLHPLALDDLFDGVQAVEFKRHSTVTVKHDLTFDEYEHQKNTKILWDPPRKKARSKRKGEGHEGKRSRLPEILKARMKCVHIACGDYAYGDQGASDYCSEGDLEGTLGTIRPAFGAATSDEQAHISPSAKSNREKLLKDTENNWSSSRIMELLKILKTLLKDKDGGKILIFDEFLQTLDVISNALRASKIPFLQLNGHLPMKKRDGVIEQFMDKKDKIRILVLTIQCGGLGLTLTQATSVFIMTPRWNPFLDLQAIARANRKGQMRKVTVWEFYSHKSIERRVIKARQKKLKKSDTVLRPTAVPDDVCTSMMLWNETTFREKLPKLQLKRPRAATTVDQS